ncbi:Hypothetical predicted protein [Octopus vulgaris]|uniref:Uncharacterized protein n=1 Tax=Octopus vulgaris TaxID=6645 RepID=A0AA36AJR9_OCTVU|nr:Hypothetical predicted protein [Octopus vulgaris]
MLTYTFIGQVFADVIVQSAKTSSRQPPSNNDNQDMDKEWSTFRKAITEVAENILGYSKRRHQEWFDDNDQEISQLIDTKQQARLSREQDPRSRQKVKTCYTLSVIKYMDTNTSIHAPTEMHTETHSCIHKSLKQARLKKKALTLG